MTNEEAIKVIEILEKRYITFDNEERQALIMAIKALEQEPCEDAVSRKAVINTLDNMDKALDTDRTVESYKELLTECYKVLPSVTPKEKTGHWIYKLEDWNRWTCSECGFSKRTDVHVKLGFKFCPNCGVRMVSE